METPERSDARTSPIERSNRITRRFFTLFTTATLSAALISSVIAMPATPDTQRDALITQLDRQAQRLAWDAQTTKGGPRAQCELQRFQVKKLIERLQTGDAVDPHEIDTLLKQQPWPRY